MKQIVYLDKQKKEREFLITCWESAHNVDIIECSTEADAIKKIGDINAPDKILFIKDDKEQIEFNEFFEDLFEQHPSIKIVLKTDSQELKDIIKELCDEFYTINDPFSQLEVAEVFSKLKIDNLPEFINGYQRIRLFNFLKYEKAISDIYILVGSEKMLKVINEGEENSVDILKKYQQKEVKYLYVKVDNLAKYLERSSEILYSAYANVPKEPEKRHQLHRLSLENANASLVKMGISPLVIELSKVTMNSVMHDIKEEKDLWKIFLNSLKEGSFLGNHSIGIAILSCGIASKMKWRNEFTTRKLVTAACLHDITLSSDKIAMINNEDDKGYEMLTSKEKAEFHTHPQKAVEFLKKFPGIASNVDTIILEHHERPGGKGFPRQLDSMNISPLGAIMVLAEDFYHRSYAIDFDKDKRQEIFDAMKEEYSAGSYKEAFAGLVEMFD